MKKKTIIIGMLICSEILLASCSNNIPLTTSMVDDSKKSKLKYDPSNHIDYPQEFDDDTWAYYYEYEDFLKDIKTLDNEFLFIQYDEELAWWHELSKPYSPDSQLYFFKLDTSLSNEDKYSYPTYLYECLSIYSEKIGYKPFAYETTGPQSFVFHAMFCPIAKDYKKKEIRSGTNERYITEETYYNIYGIDGEEEKLLGTIYVQPNQISINEDDIVDYINTYLKSNKK